MLGFRADPEIFIWSFAWWPHAILHWQDPFVSYVIWAPDGTNLAWTTSVPGLALLFAPLTLAAGPVVSFDIASMLMPALAAWTAFLLCRHLTRSFWPSLAGGYLFGFSAYMLGALEGHMHLTSVFLIPLVALVILRFVEESLSGRRTALYVGFLFAFQLSFSIEVTLTLTLTLIIVLALAFVIVRDLRGRMLALVPPLLAGGALAAALASPLLYYLLTDFHRGAINTGAPSFADVGNFVVPTDLVAFGKGWTHGITRHFFSNRSEQAAYLGVPLLVISIWFAVRRWRNSRSRFLIAAVAVAAFLSLGSWLEVLGHKVVTLPWEHVAYLPLFDNVYPARLAAYVALGVAVITAAWASSHDIPLGIRTALVVAAVIVLLPNPTTDAWSRTPSVPPFITHDLYKRCINRGENVLAFPFGPQGDSMLWQADTGFWFRMAGAWIAPTPPPSFMSPPGVADIAIYHAVPDTDAGPVREYVRLKKVSVILLDPAISDLVDWRRVLRKIERPVAVGGMLVYRLHGSAPGPC